MGEKNKSARRSADAYGKTQRLADQGEVGRDVHDTDQPAFEKVGSQPETAPVTSSALIAETGSGPGRVARLLIAMGPDRAAEVLERLDPSEVEMVAQAVIRTPKVRSEDAARLLEAIGQSAQAKKLAGGPEVAREMLVRAFGEDKGERFFHDAVPHAAPKHFQFLDDLEPHQLRLLFRDESAGAIAVVITHLDRASAGEVLSTLSPDRQTDVVRRVARMGRLNRDVIVRIEEAVREKIRQQGHQVTQSVDGNEKLAAILRHMSPSAEGEILRALEVVDPELSRSVKERLYTTDLLLLLGDRDLADLLRDFGDIELALFMKGKTDEIRARLLRAVSERRRAAIAEEYAHLGTQKRSDVDEITHELLERLRELEEEGTILVPRDGDRYI
jgi:flagellar motor switch protein FliG